MQTKDSLDILEIFDFNYFPFWQIINSIRALVVSDALANFHFFSLMKRNETKKNQGL